MARAPRKVKAAADPAPEKEAAARRRPPSWEQRLLLLRGLLFVLVAAFILFFGLYPRAASFTVNARTESLELTLRPEDRLPAWGKPSAILDTIEQKAYPCTDVAFEPNSARRKNLMIRIGVRDETPAVPAAAQSVSSAKSPALMATFNDASEPLGTLVCDGKRSAAEPPFALIFRPAGPGDGLAIPFIGILRLGGDVAAPAAPDPPAQPPLLLDGTLTIDATAWPFPTGRAQSQVGLNMGDVVTLVGDDAAADRLEPSAGVIRTTASAFDDSWLQVVAQGDALQAKVDSSYQTGKTAGYAPTFWARIQAMGQWAALIALATLALGLLDLAKDYLAIRREYRPTDTEGESR